MLITTLFRVRPCTLCTVHAQASVTENCTLCISGEDALPGLILIFVKTGVMGTTSLSLANALSYALINCLPALKSSNFM